MAMDAAFLVYCTTWLLDLNDFHVTACIKEEDAIYFWLAPNQTTRCPHCGGACGRHRKRTANTSIADLPIGTKRVWLRVRRDQYRCHECNSYFTPACHLIAEHTWVTQRFLDWAVDLIKHSDIAQVARQLDIPESSLGRWYYAELQRRKVDEASPDAQPIRALGIDELSVKKRHRQYVAVLVDHTNCCVLEVLNCREKWWVKMCLQRLKNSGRLDQLEEVSCDMWDGYVNAVKEVFGPDVKVPIDRFHVMKAFQDQLNKARRSLQNKLSETERKALKGSRWWWTTNYENLNTASRRELAKLKRQFPQLGALHDQREQLRAIFEERQTVSGGRERLKAWMETARQLGLKALDAFCGTLERWLDGVTQYFAHRTTNGRTEGFNRGLRCILWRACGMQNISHFRLRVLHAFGPHRTKSTEMTN